MKGMETKSGKLQRTYKRNHVGQKRMRLDYSSVRGYNNVENEQKETKY